MTALIDIINTDNEPDIITQKLDSMNHDITKLHKAINLSAVARELGVSRGYVSNAKKGTEKFSPAVQAKYDKLCDDIATSFKRNA